MNFLIKDDKMLIKYNEVWEKSFGLEIWSFGLDMPQVSPCPTTITKKKQYDSAEIYVGANDLLIWGQKVRMQYVII